MTECADQHIHRYLRPSGWACRDPVYRQSRSPSLATPLISLVVVHRQLAIYALRRFDYPGLHTVSKADQPNGVSRPHMEKSHWQIQPYRWNASRNAASISTLWVPPADRTDVAKPSNPAVCRLRSASIRSTKSSPSSAFPTVMGGHRFDRKARYDRSDSRNKSLRSAWSARLFG